MTRRQLITSTLAVFVLVSSRIAAAADPLLERDVLPILAKQCMGCHGGLKKEGKLDLRTVAAMLKGGESGPAVKPGSIEQSILWKRISDDEMPEGKNKLSAKEKSVLRQWISAGMPTLADRMGKQADPLLPAQKKYEPQQVAETIDRHINTTLASAKLKPAPRSDDAEFLRRVYLDLTGRVPTGQQAAAFLDDAHNDKRAKLIDTLLATPEFGEQFRRTWRDWICPPELPSDANGGKQPHREAQAFGKWLGERFAAGNSWDKIVREILTVEGKSRTSHRSFSSGWSGRTAKRPPMVRVGPWRRYSWACNCNVLNVTTTPFAIGHSKTIGRWRLSSATSTETSRKSARQKTRTRPRSQFPSRRSRT
jgi:hypothetical protein